jgi:hypothetical protein
MTAYAANEKCSVALKLSGCWGRSEVTGRLSKWRFLSRNKDVGRRAQALLAEAEQYYPGLLPPEAALAERAVKDLG